MTPVATSIQHKLTRAFTPAHLDIINESHMHSVPPGSESHFKVVLVSASFEGMRQVQRHQAVYAQLTEEMAQGVHALALHTYSPAEWDTNQSVPASPNCLGGSKH